MILLWKEARDLLKHHSRPPVTKALLQSICSEAVSKGLLDRAERPRYAHGSQTHTSERLCCDARYFTWVRDRVTSCTEACFLAIWLHMCDGKRGPTTQLAEGHLQTLPGQQLRAGSGAASRARRHEISYTSNHFIERSGACTAALMRHLEFVLSVQTDDPASKSLQWVAYDNSRHFTRTRDRTTHVVESRAPHGPVPRSFDSDGRCNTRLQADPVEVRLMCTCHGEYGPPLWSLENTRCGHYKKAVATSRLQELSTSPDVLPMGHIKCGSLRRIIISSLGRALWGLDDFGGLVLQNSPRMRGRTSGSRFTLDLQRASVRSKKAARLTNSECNCLSREGGQGSEDVEEVRRDDDHYLHICDLRLKPAVTNCKPYSLSALDKSSIVHTPVLSDAWNLVSVLTSESRLTQSYRPQTGYMRFATECEHYSCRWGATMVRGRTADWLMDVPNPGYANSSFICCYIPREKIYSFAHALRHFPSVRAVQLPNYASWSSST
ncbi:hypothetical protein BC629DRAFT_1438696 [Irpex lacteus]|nr:hypothetical protein BC629DRAFT_1438696 [Irpex lacteus]